jgi:hypothetical protein
MERMKQGAIAAAFEVGRFLKESLGDNREAKGER